MSLRDTTDVLLYDPTKTALWLMLADKRIREYEADPEHFILPRKYALLGPIIEAYAGNLGGFVKYVSGFVDSLREAGHDHSEVYALQRKLDGRYAQRVRRERGDRAVAKAVELHGAASPHTRILWLAKLEHTWKKLRLAWLAAHRKGARRLQKDVQDQLLDEFWELIDGEITAGERIPPWSWARGPIEDEDI